jgi:hypothetical protein
MTPQIQDWHTKIDYITKEFKERFSDLSTQEINQKPSADSWSVAENLQHLIAVNESYFPTFVQLSEGKYKAPFIAKIPMLVNAMGKLILKSVSPIRQKKIKTFPVWEPAQGKIEGDIIKRFSDQQNKLKSWVEKLEPNIAKGAIIASPANQSVVYTLEKAIEIIVSHEHRHLNQSIESFDTIFENQYNIDV